MDKGKVSYSAMTFFYHAVCVSRFMIIGVEKTS